MDLRSGGRQSFAAGMEGVPVFVVSGLSKIAGLPQMKAAWIVATGPDAAEATGTAGGDCRYVSLDECAGAVGDADVAARDGSDPEADSRAGGGNLAELDRQLAELPAQRLEVEGGWYAVLRIPALQPDEQTVLELLERGVWVHPGYFFGMEEAGWLVVSLLGPEEEFCTGVTRLLTIWERIKVVTRRVTSSSITLY